MSNTIYQHFVEAIEKVCEGIHISTKIADRAVLSTDNSVYQAMPEVVIYPRSTPEVMQIMRLLAEDRFKAIKLSPRGGGSGTDGQSLTHGVILDCSRYLQKLGKIDLKQQTIDVEVGVVLDRLQAQLATKNVFLPCRISSGSRACIGGMINTNAAGVGSACFGRLQDWVVSLTCVLVGGDVITVTVNDIIDIAHPGLDDKKLQSLYQAVYALIEPHAKQIKSTYQDQVRTQCGYALHKLIGADGHAMSLLPLLCGSEGTLAVVTSCQLKVLPIPSAQAVAVLLYPDLQQAVADTKIRESTLITGAEILDEHLLAVLEKCQSHHPVIQMAAKHQYQAMVILEISASSEKALEAEWHRLQQLARHGHYIARDTADIDSVWAMRKDAVGYVSGLQDGERRPVPFIEDTAVPVAQLGPYLHELKRLLEQYGLLYGMYGHLDSGCIHVRPALNLLDKQDQQLMVDLMQAVVKLVKKYQGVFAGEHGYGYRSELNQRFMPAELIDVMAKIKALFDPRNQLNPGKLAVADGVDAQLHGLTDDLRAQKDRLIPKHVRDEAANTTRCNGNGACFNTASTVVMCPSYQVTQDRVHSPKGRATLYKMWLAQKNNHALTDALYEAMQGCLECQGCRQQCPMHVNIPEAKHHFLMHYHEGYGRRWSDRWFADLESYISLCRSKAWYYVFIGNPISRLFSRQVLGLEGLPSAPDHSYRRLCRVYGINKYRRGQNYNDRTVFILPDVLTAAFEPDLLIDAYQLLLLMGYEPMMLPPQKSGKALYSAGCANGFVDQAQRNYRALQPLAAWPVLCIEPSIYYCYARDYPEDCQLPHLQLFSQWLAEQCQASKPLRKKTSNKTYTLIGHCMEQASPQRPVLHWTAVYKYFGVKLLQQATGCCGMAGSYGYRTDNQQNSQQLFEKNWLANAPQLKKMPEKCLATGFSCRQQIKRQLQQRIKHPIQQLLAELE